MQRAIADINNINNWHTGGILPAHLVLGCVIALWEVSIDLSIVKQVIINKIPSPALIITTQQCNIALALHGCPFGRDANHCHCAQRPLPPDFPGMPALREADFCTSTIGTLSNWVTVECESIFLYIHVPGAVVGAQGMLKWLQLRRQWKRERKCFSSSTTLIIMDTNKGWKMFRSRYLRFSIF